MFLPPPHLLLALSLNLANSVKCRSVEPSCLMIKWSDLQPAPAWERQGSDFNPSTCSAGLIKMNFLQATTLPTGQESSYIRNPLLRYCIKFIVGRHRRTLRFIYLLHFFFSLSAFFPVPFHLFIVIITLESKLALAKIALWKRMELLWGPAHLLLPGPSLSQRERQREGDGGEQKMKKKKKMKWETGAEEKREVAYSKLWISLTYISEYFTTSSRKALSPPKGNTGRADRARESKPLTCWRLNK